MIENFSAITDEIKNLSDLCLENSRIDPELYSKYDVKRGLRDRHGKGVLTGLTEIGEVQAYTIDDDEMVPCEGKLYYSQRQYTKASSSAEEKDENGSGENSESQPKRNESGTSGENAENTDKMPNAAIPAANSFHRILNFLFILFYALL